MPATPPTFKVLSQFTARSWKPIAEDASAGEDSNSLNGNALRDHLLDIIGSPNLLVLAGNGTSLGEKVGGPSMQKLWDQVTKLSAYPEAAKAVGQPESDTNVETLLSRCKSALQFVSKEQRDKVSGFINLAEKEINTQCSEFLMRADLGDHREFLRRVGRRSASKPRLKLFTTNYDRCFEESADGDPKRCCR